jgi:hypothetical protein
MAAPSLPEPETSMNRKILSATVALALAAAGTAFAQQSTGAQDAPQRTHHQKLDVNNDGVIDRTEAAAAPRLAERFDQLDRNKDGKLAADERPQRHGWHRGGRGGHRMMQADTDKDGRISKAEAAANPKFAERFAEMDFNKDGFVDRTDFEAKMAQRRSECFDKVDINKDGKLSRVEYSTMPETCGMGKRDGSRMHADRQNGAVSTK